MHLALKHPHTEPESAVYEQHLEHAYPQKVAMVLEESAAAKALRARFTEEVGKIDPYALPFFRYVNDSAYLEGIETLAKTIRGKFRDLVLIGTGGSSLGTKAVGQISPTPAMRIHFLENSDPDTADHLLATLDPQTTFLLIISKSGSTIEVTTHAAIWLGHLKDKLGDKVSEHAAIVSQPGNTPIREMAEHFNITSLHQHDTDIGGRYSVFSNVGMLPLACLGLDIKKFCAGAVTTLDQFQSGGAKSAPALGALMQSLYMQHGRAIHVLMPYGDRLQTFSYWYRQLVSESLGKNGKGVTPLTALGAIDQHSMLQLFLDGPEDKWFTLVTRDASGLGPSLDLEGMPSGHEYLAHKSLGDIIQSSQYGTTQSIIHQGLPLRLLHLQAFDETSIGALMAHFMLETVLSAALIEVNPYDQPAVEEGKKFARQYLERTP